MKTKKTTDFVRTFGINKRELATQLRFASVTWSSGYTSAKAKAAFKRIANLLEHGADIK